MFKKIIFSLLLFLIILSFVNNVFSSISDTTFENSNDISVSVDAENNLSSKMSFPNINARSAIVFDRNSNQVIFGKNENVKRKMASTTKIMTCIIALENANLDDIVTISSKAALTGGSRLGLSKDDKISIQNLLYGLMLCSGNDAAVALSEHIARKC